MGRKKKHCNECLYYSKKIIKEHYHHPASSVPEVIDREFGFCDQFVDILPNDPDLLINMARGCGSYEKEEQTKLVKNYENK